MNWKSLIAIVALGLWSSCGSNGDSGTKEQCGNQVDDDQDGLLDCQDPDCTSDPVCDTAARCPSQKFCFGSRGFDDYRNNPMPVCIPSEGCVTPEASIDIYFQVKRPGYVGTPIGSIQTRFIKKVALDGTPVDCNRMREIAAGTTQDKAGQIEATGILNFQAWDVTPYGGDTGGTPIPLPTFSVTTGSDFLIWTELWAGKPDSNSGLPTGNRYNFVCIDSGPLVAPIVPEDNWPNPGAEPHGRTITIEVPR